MMARNMMRNVFNFVILFQVITFFIFLVDNINTLSSIEYTFDFGGTPYTLDLDLYAFLVLLGIIFAVTLIASISILGIGFNDEGTKTITKYLSFIIMYILFSISLAFYFTYLGVGFAIIEFLIVIVYFAYLVTENATKE